MFKNKKFLKIKFKPKAILPEYFFYLYDFLFDWGNLLKTLQFLFNRHLRYSFIQRIFLTIKVYRTSYFIKCPHKQFEILTFIENILSIPQNSPGVIVEAGCFKGCSTAKISVAAALAGRKLVVFDSFKGIPKNNEPRTKNLLGIYVSFDKGDFRGKLDEVMQNIRTFGNLEVCEFIEGWFHETMPYFSEPIAAIYLDVDLAESTRTCLKYLYPLLVPGGFLYSHDGHLPLVINVFNDEQFWETQVGCPKPLIEGLGKKRLIRAMKPREEEILH